MKPKAKPAHAEILGMAQDELYTLLLPAIKAIADCMRHPERHSQTKMASAKIILDRTLPMVANTQISSEVDGAQVTLNVNFLPPKKDEE